MNKFKRSFQASNFKLNLAFIVKERTNKEMRLFFHSFPLEKVWPLYVYLFICKRSFEASYAIVQNMYFFWVYLYTHMFIYLSICSLIHRKVILSQISWFFESVFKPLLSAQRNCYFWGCSCKCGTCISGKKVMNGYYLLYWMVLA